MKHEDHLAGQPKPTVEQAAWLFCHLTDAASEPGSYRYLIYDRMGYGPEAYCTLLSAGAMMINNILVDQNELLQKSREVDEKAKKIEVEILRAGRYKSQCLSLAVISILSLIITMVTIITQNAIR